MGAELAIGIDLGGTQLRLGLVTRDGFVVRRLATRTDVAGGPRAVLAQIGVMFDEIVSAADVSLVSGIGISTPGPVDTEAGIVLDIPTLKGWQNAPFMDMIAQRFSLPTLLEGDAIAAAIGEWQFGAARGARHAVYVTVSTGIGGGAISDGRVVRGRRGLAGHVGHIILERSSAAVCSCGTNGCFEALAAGPALEGRASVRSLEPSGAVLRRCAAGGRVEARHVFESARVGDQLALELVDEEALWLGAGFASILHCYSPEVLVMGGGVSNGFDLLLPGISREVQRLALPAFRDVKIVVAALGDNAGLVGAASLAFGTA